LKSLQVQIFETEALDLRGQVTHSLLNSASHRKDNRIFSLAFDVRRLVAKGVEAFRIHSVGVEIPDGFRPGSALTIYKIPLPSDLSRPVVVVCVETVLRRPANAAQGV
jgi:hypothetical protein